MIRMGFKADDFQLLLLSGDEFVLDLVLLLVGVTLCDCAANRASSSHCSGSAGNSSHWWR
jgi:hypothetical protein